MAKAIMIQGTMSNAGKSLLVAALCRIFTQDGYKVAPFKSQNMALNSFITEEGLEMGRAQVVQAEASNKKPDVRMNPILLKPTTDVGSQVILNGKVFKNMKAKDYFEFKPQLVGDIMKSYNSLAEENDIIVIEGAGSPAEINLKKNDIVNMGMAKMAKAPVLLVGDIDRGGVFAQLYGTVALLEPSEIEMTKGLIVNKFRGDVEILKPGINQLSEKMKDIKDIPVVGIVPHIDVDIDDEDSLSSRFDKKTMVKEIDIAVIKLPHISNFTDVTPFERYKNVSLRYISKVSELKNPDMIIIPGTKSTISDLMWLRETGLEGAIKKQASKGKLIFGICGGFQIIGEKLSDPYCVENGGETQGMGLLNIETVFEEEKITKQVKGVFENVTGNLNGLNGVEFQGYEIHMGISKGQKNPLMCFNNAYGSYIHGIFDSKKITDEIVKVIAIQKGLNFYEDQEYTEMSIEEYKNIQYDKLAAEVRKSLDMQKIYEILDAGI